MEVRPENVVSETRHYEDGGSTKLITPRGCWLARVTMETGDRRQVVWGIGRKDEKTAVAYFPSGIYPHNYKTMLEELNC